MAEQRIQVPGEIAIKVSIGEVCVQWARLEMTLLGLIAQIEPMEMEQCFIVFGGLDMLPRVNMAMKLARYEKVPQRLIRRIVAVRKCLQGGLDERRNQVVHGSHKDEDGVETTLTMVRWLGDKRHKRINAVEITQLAQEIHDLGSEVWAIQTEIVARDLRKHMQENLGDDLAKS